MDTPKIKNFRRYGIYYTLLRKIHNLDNVIDIERVYYDLRLVSYLTILRKMYKKLNIYITEDEITTYNIMVLKSYPKYKLSIPCIIKNRILKACSNISYSFDQKFDIYGDTITDTLAIGRFCRSILQLNKAYRYIDPYDKFKLKLIYHTCELYFKPNIVETLFQIPAEYFSSSNMLYYWLDTRYGIGKYRVKFDYNGNVEHAPPDVMQRFLKTLVIKYKTRHTCCCYFTNNIQKINKINDSEREIFGNQLSECDISNELDL